MKITDISDIRHAVCSQGSENQKQLLFQVLESIADAAETDATFMEILSSGTMFTYQSNDGALAIEWATPDQRLGFYAETCIEESSWHALMKAANGDMDTIYDEFSLDGVPDAIQQIKIFLKNERD